MKKSFFAAIAALYLIGSVNVMGTSLVINEFLASNRNNIQDLQGHYDDWIEIYNYGTDAVDVGGMYLTDNMSAPMKWQIPANNYIPAGGYLLIWADNDTADAGLHANYQLSAGGEEIGLFDTDGVTLLDSIVFGEQTNDISYGRYPNAGEDWQFFAHPSPGVENTIMYDGFVSEVEFSHERGFYGTAFTLTIATETEDAVIYYSLDGSEPYKLTTRGNALGRVYTDPITISGTSCLRAIATREGWKPSKTVTHTYIFVEDVARQSSDGQAPYAGWPNGNPNGQMMNYGMDPEVFNDPRYEDLMDDALLAIPSISLVTDLENLFDPATGIYVNARSYGRSWERPVSVELINPDVSEGFQINAGLRVRGGYSRHGVNPKHAFRLFFRAEYGQPKLRFPLFGDEGVSEFDNIDLRTSQNYSWSYDGSDMNTMVREVFSRDVQRDMGQPYTRSRYYHLYLNGQYWGIFQTQERSEASYAEAYFGGNKEDYDVIKTTGGNPNYTIEATDGTLDVYRRIWVAARAGFNTDEDYYKIQGLNPDGTRNPDYERLVDIDNLIDYMLCTFYVGDCDGPISNFLGNSRTNNYYGIYNLVNPDGFKFFRHDGEHTIGVRNWCYDRTGPYSAGQQFADFNPQWLHQQLAVHPEYRVRMGDRAHKYLFNNGVLTPGESTARLMERARRIETAIIAESARWGDSKRSTPFTRDEHWWPEIDRIVNDYDGYGFSTRTQVLLSQLQSKGWYPIVDAPVFHINGGYQHGGIISKNDVLSMHATTGTIWYTLDGSDPRSRSSSEPGANSNTLVPEHADKRVLVPSSPVNDNWKGGGTFEDSTWLYCTGSPGGVGFERTSGYQDLINLDLQQQMYARNATCYIRIPFTIDIDDMTEFTSLTLKVKYDDGFVAYLNGAEVARRNFNGTPSWNSRASSSHSDSLAVQFESIDISDSFSLMDQGNNVLAIQGMNSSTTSGDFLISVELVAGTLPKANQYIEPIKLGHSANVKARVLSGDTWSALNETIFAVGPLVQNLRITEIMYHPQNLPDIGEPNEEFIELTNIGAETINLNLVRFTNGIDFSFPSLDLAPREYVVVIQDREAFEARYGVNITIAGQYTGRLNNAGERITLEDALGQTILDFSYRDGWRPLTDGEGFSLTIIDPANPDLNSWDDKDAWRAGTYIGGSPGQDDSGILPNPDDVVINELLANSPGGDPDWIELYNTTEIAIDLDGWFLSDSNDNLFKYEIAPGTTIGPNEYLVFYQDL
ncbi:lamin tail domain-containing protein, partial [Planctomycetota bacterium]